MQTIERLKDNAVQALISEIPHSAQYAYAFGVIGGAIGFYPEHEIQSLYKAMNIAIDASRIKVAA